MVCGVEVVFDLQLVAFPEAAGFLPPRRTGPEEEGGAEGLVCIN